jgi:hypothetical protein
MIVVASVLAVRVVLALSSSEVSVRQNTDRV